MTNVVDAFLGRDKGATAPLRNFRPTGIQTGGFTFAGGRKGQPITGGATAERLGLLSEASNLFKQQAGEVRGLRSLVAPGFSQFRTALRGVQQARLGSMEAERTRTLGDLRENLARRRVLGSSFGQDALSRANAEFAKQRDEVMADIGLQEAQTTLQELEATRALIGEEFNLARGSVQTFIDNLNLEAGIATQLATQATSALASNAQAQAQILQKQIDNTQEFLTELAGVGLGAAGAPQGVF